MSREERIQLKEKYLDKLCNVRMQILGPSAAYENPIYNILAIDVANLQDDQFEPLDIDDIIGELDSNFD